MNSSINGPKSSTSLSFSVHSSTQNELQVSDQKNSNPKAPITFRNYIIKHLLDVSLPVLSSQDQEMLQKYIEEMPQSIRNIAIEESSVSSEPVRKKARCDGNNNAQNLLLEIKEVAISDNVVDSVPLELFAKIFNYLSKKDFFSFKNCNKRSNEIVKGFWKDRKVLYTSDSKRYNCLEFDSKSYPDTDSFKYLSNYLSWCLERDKDNITALKFNSLNWLTDDHLIELEPFFKQIRRLETLVLNDCTQITGKFMRLSPNIKGVFDILSVLSFAKCPNIDEDLLDLERFERLKKLDISGIPSKDEVSFFNYINCNNLLSNLTIRLPSSNNSKVFSALETFVASAVCLLELHVHLPKQDTLTEKQKKVLKQLGQLIIRQSDYNDPEDSNYQVRSNSVRITYHYDPEMYDPFDCESDGYDSQSDNIIIN